MEKKNFIDRLMPVPKNGGFKIDGYYVWCGSVIKGEDGKFHMFASRWPKNTEFPKGYMTHSEIVRAVSDTPEGPYKFEEIIISGREKGYWDSQMAHNPNIIKIGDTFVLYYIGNSDGTVSTRRIGYAYSKSVYGPWQRMDNCIDLLPDSNNPSVCVKSDGSVLLVFRHSKMRLGIAAAPSFNEKYTVLNEDIMPGISLEDPYLFYSGSRYEMILEDNVGKLTGHVRFGAHLISEDGINNWRKNDPVICYSHTITWDDGTTTTADRRERPQLLFDEEGQITHLMTAIQSGNETWNIVQPLNLILE